MNATEPVARICIGGVCGTGTEWAIGGGSVAGAAVLGLSAWAWLRWLRWLPLMGLFTRLRSDRLLDHPVRARVHALVAAEPGIHQQRLIEQAAISKGQAGHHISVLVRAGLLTAVRSRGFTLYFHKGAMDVRVMQALLGLKSVTSRRALLTVAAQPGIAKRALARELGCSESTLRHHVKRLVGYGLLRDAEGLHIEPLGSEALAVLPEAMAQPAWPPGSAPQVQ